MNHTFYKPQRGRPSLQLEVDNVPLVDARFGSGHFAPPKFFQQIFTHCDRDLATTFFVLASQATSTQSVNAHFKANEDRRQEDWIAKLAP